MNIVALIGSSRKHGNTARIVEMVEEELRALAQRRGLALEFQSIVLADANIEWCRGCRSCFNRGEECCPAHDGFAAVREAVRAADGLIVASPVYVNDVSGPVKNWIDRMAYACHRPELAGKCAVALATVGSGPSTFALQTMTFALGSWGCHVVARLGLKMGALTPREDAEQKFRAQARRAAGALFAGVTGQVYLRPTFLALMMFKIQQAYYQKHADDSFDSRYWSEKGWVKPSTSFYIPHRAGFVKTGLARLAGALIGPFVS